MVKRESAQYGAVCGGGASSSVGKDNEEVASVRPELIEEAFTVNIIPHVL
jgi:hypothetical protein